MIEVKTRDDSPVQGKQRVFFTCHPDDHERFFEQIKKELWKIIDCAVYYTTDENYENVDEELKNMNLLVIPITTKLLTKPCRAMNVDVPYAVENNIPILPLMQENGLDELFNKKFGDRHYLNPNENDEKRLSYKEKLEKYLTSVLVSDELAAKVRAAFDAYIFLSYRKKDVEYANKLRQLIHKNDFCRDIAIWYDDYLVPGEDFNQAIKDAINKSDLFTLVVTPNLINEDNYVRREEYPAAKDSKPVIPVELVKTDHRELSKQYPGIPESIDAKDETALSKVFESTLLSIARRENDNDPQHNFFIGLAYLNGIDVDIDYKLALSLITSAAESKENKVPEAIEKLVSMYKEGHGVERNYRTAAEWQGKLVNYWEEKYKKSQYLEDYSKLFDEIQELTEQFYNIWDLNNAEKYCKKMVALCNQLMNKTGSFEIRQNLSTSYNNLGCIYAKRYKLEKAEEFFRKSLVIDEQLAEETETEKDRYNLSVSYDKIGNIYKAHGNLDMAEDFYRKTLVISEQLVEETESMDASRIQSLSYDNLGDIFKARGKFDVAEEYYNKSFIIIEKILAQTKAVTEIYRLAECYNTLGDLYYARSNFEKAEEFYIQSHNIDKQLVEELNTIESRKNLSISYAKLGNICYIRGNIEEAEMFYKKLIIISEQIVDETGTVESKNYLSGSYSYFGDIYYLCGNFDESEKFYRKSIDIMEQLKEVTENWDIKRNLSVFYSNLGILFYERKKFDKAEEFYMKSFVIDKQLAEENGTVLARKDLSQSYKNLGQVFFKREDTIKADEFYRKSLELRIQLNKETATIESKQDLADIYNSLGDFYKARGNLDSAESFYCKELDISEQLIKENDNIDVYEGLAISYYNISTLREPYDRDLLKKALEIYIMLVAQCPQVMHYSEQMNMIKKTLEKMK